VQFFLREFARIRRLQNYIIYMSGDRHKQVVMVAIHRARVPLAVAPRRWGPRWKDFLYNNVRRRMAPALWLLLDGPALLRVGKFGNVQ
jgi:hypothetical protein